ncbi:MAG: HD domain-containing protein [Chloroflexi bacterium]|nr:HD domain-containing protein [Chloroflexota bacterium]
MNDQGVFTLFEGNDIAGSQINADWFIGHSVFDVFKDIPPAVDIVHRGLSGEGGNTTIIVAGSKWEIRCYPLRDTKGDVSGLVGDAKNITEQHKRESEQKSILNVLTALRKATTRTEMPPIILKQTTSLLKPEGVVLALRSSSRGGMAIEAANGIWESLIGKYLSLDKNTWPDPDAGKLIPESKVYSENEIPGKLKLNTKGNYSIIGVPLIAQEQQVGDLWIASQKSISTDDVRFLISIGEIAANAIRRATQSEQTQLRLQRLAALHDIDRAITNNTDIRDTLDTVLKHVIAQLGVHAASVLLLDSTTQKLEYVVGNGFQSNDIPHTSLRLDECLGGHIAFDRRLAEYFKIFKCQNTCPRASLLEKYGFQAYYGAPLIARGQLKGILEIFHRKPLNPECEWISFLEAIATQAAIAIDSTELFSDLQRSNAELSIAYDTTLDGWIRALDLRDKETEGHTRRVTNMTMRLAQSMGINEPELTNVRRGALLHDIGKMGISDNILNKPGPLSDNEWEVMRRHPVYAYNLLSPTPFLQDATDIPYYHHEKWDGSGYPQGLKGKEIPLTARIFTVVDVWDALRSDRPYRSAWSGQKARKYIRQQSGTHFDPRVVDKFFALGLDKTNGRN